MMGKFKHKFIKNELDSFMMGGSTHRDGDIEWQSGLAEMWSGHDGVERPLCGRADMHPLRFLPIIQGFWLFAILNLHFYGSTSLNI